MDQHSSSITLEFTTVSNRLFKSFQSEISRNSIRTLILIISLYHIIPLGIYSYIFIYNSSKVCIAVIYRVPNEKKRISIGIGDGTKNSAVRKGMCSVK